MAAVDLIRGGAELDGGHSALEVRREELILAGDDTFVDTSGQASSGQGSFHSAMVWFRPCAAASATISAGTPL